MKPNAASPAVRRLSLGASAAILLLVSACTSFAPPGEGDWAAGRDGTEAVIRVLQESELRRRLSAAALELASEHDWSTVVQVLERAIREACDDAATRGAAQVTG